MPTRRFNKRLRFHTNQTLHWPRGCWKKERKKERKKVKEHLIGIIERSYNCQDVTSAPYMHLCNVSQCVTSTTVHCAQMTHIASERQKGPRKESTRKWLVVSRSLTNTTHRFIRCSNSHGASHRLHSTRLALLHRCPILCRCVQRSSSYKPICALVKSAKATWSGLLARKRYTAKKKKVRNEPSKPSILLRCSAFSIRSIIFFFLRFFCPFHW